MAIMEGSNPTTIKWHLKEYDSRGSNEYAKGMTLYDIGDGSNGSNLRYLSGKF